ncbi:PEP-CTERM sorting domain-containing protein [Sphingomonas panacisoli]|uniref:PEP-CTERM sorting domain-containing protein n=1 Tax=Sphingomonas panacisoli TaxID=1813879 RepID=A0A5B8LLZ2_9SPHN|nr:PEP-CTERM sorting domain-containing protein [Sphingomonas panacisoli]
MFRYSNDPHNQVPGNGPVLDLSIGTASYFSTDGGLTQWGGNALFATGSYNGDGDQASHWKDASGVNACGPQLGIMDPTFCYAQRGEVTALDLAAFDAIGWNIAVNSRGSNYLMNTAQIYRQFATTPVPEPTTWAMMIVGFGLMGGAMRRSRKVASTRVSFA